jgi:hypothetical protein
MIGCGRRPLLCFADARKPAPNRNETVAVLEASLHPNDAMSYQSLDAIRKSVHSIF